MRGSARAGPKSGVRPPRPTGEGTATDVGQGPGPAAGKRPVEEARHTQLGTEPAGELVAQGHGGGEVLGGGAARLVGDEGHDVEHAQAWVGPGVVPQVETGDGRSGERPGGRGDGVGGSGQGEDGAVVVRVAVQIEQGRCGGVGQPAENGRRRDPR